ncbi:putative asparaginase [Leptomonas pyrrhocoris]|uniref:beta-aspartyl-peptidase n=1 Tax=Leptomonas pyrrhocoris TaxID=157538 RepID=A0A0M9G232_LEPPY|nr:putative asparaginase [Leptomonas pyrrhocoris]KPA80627.1 putative asparaginase [Leptomonas pyrrhocoris]|eukprot:XP_015659066.1 putative asparaginase [Leptomonas pyrrhocoris]
MSAAEEHKIVPVIALHAGAGTIRRDTMTPEQETAYRAGLRDALEAGRTVLLAGGNAMDAVTAAVVSMEDNPLFNAGRGSVFTSDRTHEMDAAVMSGVDRACGAITGICGPRNPVLAARAVMEKSEHVFLAGDGARRFTETSALTMMPPTYFDTESRLKALEAELAHRASGASDDHDEARKHGTVGAAALDVHGNVAAATSTGGMTAKMPGRVGDSPVIGAGTWADNRTCAISATGHGEYFIRFAVGHEVDARMRLCHESLAKACADVIKEVGEMGGSGGLVAVDAHGNVALPLNCSGMYRAWMGRDGVVHTAIFHDDDE